MNYFRSPNHCDYMWYRALDKESVKTVERLREYHQFWPLWIYSCNLCTVIVTLFRSLRDQLQWSEWNKVYSCHRLFWSKYRNSGHSNVWLKQEKCVQFIIYNFQVQIPDNKKARTCVEKTGFVIRECIINKGQVGDLSFHRLLVADLIKLTWQLVTTKTRSKICLFWID